MDYGKSSYQRPRDPRLARKQQEQAGEVYDEEWVLNKVREELGFDYKNPFRDYADE